MAGVFVDGREGDRNDHQTFISTGNNNAAFYVEADTPADSSTAEGVSAPESEAIGAEITRLRAMADVYHQEARLAAAEVRGLAAGMELPEVPRQVPLVREARDGWFIEVLALWPPDQRATASCVAFRESTNRPSAVNGEHSGLYQINVRVHRERIYRLGYTEADMRLALPNAVVAHELWQEQGWAPWTTAPLCLEAGVVE